MTVLLWIRTSRHVDTLGPEVNELRLNLIPNSNRDNDWMEPFVSGDHVLFLISSNLNIHGLKAFVEPEMRRDFIVDWSLTEVGRGIGPCEAYVGLDEDGERYYDDRFRDPEYDRQYGDDEARIADKLGFSLLFSSLNYATGGATALWVSLARERKEADPILRGIERELPKPFKRMWQGRNAMLYGFTASHDLTNDAPFGVSRTIDELLDQDEVRWFLAFEVGNWSVGGAISTMNPMADWIWKRRPKGGRRA